MFHELYSFGGIIFWSYVYRLRFRIFIKLAQFVNVPVYTKAFAIYQ